MPSSELYDGREQTQVKHFILRQYLQRLAYKKGYYGRYLNYVDCFAGPWQNVSEQLDDTSPMIAINELRAVRDSLRTQNPNLEIRCLFIEKNEESCIRLREQLRHIRDVHTEVLEGEFESKIGEICHFAPKHHKSFTFFFIDPTGWTGYSLDLIRPLLIQPNSEILINFMTKDIIRFINHDRPSDIHSFDQLFGISDYRERWRHKSGLDREEAIVQTYGDLIKEAGRFEFVASTIVLHPEKDRTHFHLIYATRNIAGLQEFRNEAERAARKTQREVRFRANIRKDELRTGQMNLFTSPVGSSYLEKLEERYHLRAKDRINERLRSQTRVLFDDLEAEILQFPMTSTKEIQDWLNQLRVQGIVRFEGLAPREKTLKTKQNHYVVLQNPAPHQESLF
jgi:three-Cys-motif partner protein